MKKIDTSIFRAYDIRGIYPKEINAEVAYAIGQAYVEVVKPDGAIVIGHDVRLHSEELKKAMIEGILDAGVDAVDIGLISTEMIYFAVGFYGYAGGIQSTASHQPAEWHGAKMVKRNAEPIFRDNGMNEIKEFVLTGKKIYKERGNLSKKDILDDFCKYILTWIEPKNIKTMRIVANANFGFQGKLLDRIIEMGKLPIEIIKLNYEPDGEFPKGSPNPYLPENREEFVELVKEEEPDFGVAWDADADRVFFATGKGLFLEPYYTNTLLIQDMLKKFPGSKIVYDPRNTRALIDTIKSCGGESVIANVGHSFIKAKMRSENAVFCGESSGHTYYRDFWFADSGIIPFLQVLEILSNEKKTLDEMIEEVMKKYYISGEENFTTDKSKAIMTECEEVYSDCQIDKFEGLTIEYPDWRFNLRSSNTEPLLRINLEANSKELMERKFKEVKEIINKNC